MEIRVSFEELLDTLQAAMLRLGFAPERARLCARLFAETTRDGVYSHGLNRFPRFLETIRNGSMDVKAEAAKVMKEYPAEPVVKIEELPQGLKPGSVVR